MRVLTIALLVAALPAFSATLLGAPLAACAAMATEGLATRGWKDTMGGEYWCSSPYKELDKATGTSLANNLAYYVSGTQGTVENIWLKLNVNQKAKGKGAQKELARVTALLIQKAAGQALPAVVATAIAAGKPIETTIGSAKLSVVRDDWATGMGYSLKVTIN